MGLCRVQVGALDGRMPAGQTLPSAWTGEAQRPRFEEEDAGRVGGGPPQDREGQEAHRPKDGLGQIEGRRSGAHDAGQPRRTSGEGGRRRTQNETQEGAQERAGRGARRDEAPRVARMRFVAQFEFLERH